MKDVFDCDLGLYFEIASKFRPVSRAMPLSEFFGNIRNNYRVKQEMVDRGVGDWFHCDPYEIADWCDVFTPIEFALWQDIRRYGLDLWPQLPVGRFFVDFGNPIAKVAIECDGKEWHLDKDKDAARDQDLEEMGWMVLRIPGRQCNGRIPSWHEAQEEGMSREEFEHWRDLKTPYTALMIAKERLEWAREKFHV